MMNDQQSSMIHDVTFFQRIIIETDGIADRSTLEEIHQYVEGFASKAENVSQKNKPQLDAYKRNDAVSIVAAKLKDNTRNGDNFLSRSLLTIDLDHKVPCIFSINDMKLLLTNLNLKASIYTTVSHSNEIPRFRVLVDIGKVCDNALDFKQVAEWFINQLPEEAQELVDPASKSTVFAMLMPVAYKHVKPEVYWIDGGEIYPQHSEAVEATAITVGKKKTKDSKTNKSCSTTTLIQSDDFLKHVSLMHGSTQFARTSSSSYQFRRNASDQGAGLFCRTDERVIHDNNSSHKKKTLMYSPDDFDEASNHTLPTRDEVYQHLSDWVDSDVHMAILKENCGSGKSQSLVKLTSHDPKIDKYIFTFHMKDNRDNFYSDLNLDKSNCVVIYGNQDIIKQVISDEVRFLEIEAEYKNFNTRLMDIILKLKQRVSDDYDPNAPSKPKQLVSDLMKLGMDGMINSRIDDKHSEFSFSKFLHHAMKKKLITMTELNDINRKYQANQSKVTNKKHLIMTTRKFECLASTNKVDTFLDTIVFTDEVELGCLTPIPDGTTRTAYGYPKTLEDESGVDKRVLQKIRRCFITVEDGIEYELENLGIPFTTISGISKTLDHNLEIFRVTSTSNKKNDTKFYQTDTPREYCIKKIKDTYADSVEIIVDGGKDLDCMINHTNNKGKNNLQDKDLIVIVSYPDPSLVAHTMFYTGLSEDECVQLIISNNANQATGRNQGYRNRNQSGEPSKGTNKCLLILPSDVDLNLHNVTPNVITRSRWTKNHAEAIARTDRLTMHYRKLYYEYIKETDTDQVITDSVNNYIKQNPTEMKIDISKLGCFSGVYSEHKKFINRTLKNIGYIVKRNSRLGTYTIEIDKIVDELIVTLH